MKRLNSNVSTAKAALQQRPEILHTVNVNPTANVSLSLVNYVMHKAALHPVVIGNRVVRINGASVLHVLENLILQSLACDVRHNLSADLPQIPVKDALHNRLACRSSNVSLLLRETQTARTVHVPNLAAYKRFVHFQFFAFAANLARVKGMLFHNFADALQHKPCRRLRHSQSAAKLMRTDAVLRIRQQPKRCHPLVQTERGILKDGFNFDRELPLAGVAEPQSPRLDKRILSYIAAWAYNVAVRPAQLLGKLKGPVSVRKIDDGLLQRFRLWNVLSSVHVENDTISAHVCQLVYCR